MKYDKFGQAYINGKELCEILYQQPDIDISKFQLEDWDEYNSAVKSTYSDLPLVKEYHPLPSGYDINIFHQTKQRSWNMPKEYLDMDIAKWVLDQCKTQEELQRVGEELLLYQERDLFFLLRQLKYIVDVWRENNIVWGVGRGSSVASYVLYLIGTHKINSIYYDLDIREFLK
jgi:DNA polymerase III alpha subunit